MRREGATPTPAAIADGRDAPSRSCVHASSAPARFSPVARLLVVLVRGYQRFVSPALPPSCRFYPSCSQYALEAVQKHGAARGSWLALRRLMRCHPFNPGGPDPVP